MARLLARRHGLRHYSADAHTWEHRDRALKAGHPAAVRFEALSPAERWSRPPGELLAMSLHHERGPMIADDVRALPPVPLTVVEGTPVTPPAAGAHALWLLPTREEQRRRLADRGLGSGQLELYRLLVREIEDQVAQYGGDRLETTGDRSVPHTLALVESHFAAVLAAAPRESTAAGRGRLARYANEALVRQYEGFYARPWARGDAGDAVVDFDCECGSAGCARQVPLRVADFPGGPLLAPGHPGPAD
ncbi:hypothetical protein GCM10010387_30550 [Streptomyces inusitatus]|uniref:Uncharacterized protein n=1 Tax=Streptomyces inusitatus TaxID=68221 RepID=A0A918UUA1_9ACTN|nr:hypothetical protein [Streptomyces inusitatus]GGZ34438.1 hypothetical protein GCM10010387_30550 [Streptomyces inusitatus]